VRASAWLGADGFVVSVRKELMHLENASPGSLSTHELAGSLQVARQSMEDDARVGSGEDAQQIPDCPGSTHVAHSDTGCFFRAACLQTWFRFEGDCSDSPKKKFRPTIFVAHPCMPSNLNRAKKWVGVVSRYRPPAAQEHGASLK
jgi:hypothetical protein